MTSIIILSIALAISFAFNALFFWYNRTLLSRLSFISNNIDDLIEMITSYRKHLKSVFEMEMFYGDETLKFLLTHTKSLKELLEDYEDVLYITEPIEEIESEYEESQQEENNDGQKIKGTEENVFYAGSRRRDS
jgi:hypothetical protein|tara:strand:- start:509 stop:910 length:402 start_codon:yes stop_codon:yes gene_type:complete